MKGIIFNLLEGFITDNYGEDEYEGVLSRCQLKMGDPGVIVGPGTYPDEDFMQIVAETARLLDNSVPDVFRAFGRYAIPKLVERYPRFFSPYSHPKDFLKTVDFIHHIEIVKLYKDAETPKFSAEDPFADTLVMKYSSARKLCYLVEGLIDGLADHYGVPIEHSQTRCMIHGDEQCVFNLRFEG
ncbi:MAG: heme NO-binding domain-containing protein [Proteobacteria bacterium]|nr:heme NO-binding domain-containing protein [Pseudomonadota bacterium]MBU1708406.1 heme NO-binding domain-containing protein [Pseudomonadota bacterium]